MRPYQHVHAALAAVRAGCMADAAGEYALASAGYDRKGMPTTARVYADMAQDCLDEAARRERQASASDLIALCRRGAPLPGAVVVPFPVRERMAPCPISTHRQPEVPSLIGPARLFAVGLALYAAAMAPLVLGWV